MMRWTLALAAILVLALPVLTRAQDMPAAAPTAGEPAEGAITAADAVTYGPIEVPGFDPGMQIAAIHGDPASDGGDYTIRLKFPAGYKFPPHFHPQAEHVTVLSGTFLLGMGKTADEAAIESYSPGAFLYIPAEHPHYGGAEGETVIQLHGVGPFSIMLVE